MTEQAAADLLVKIAPHGFSIWVWSYILIAVIALIGGFLSGYLKQRGKNYATRQDLAGLLEQIKSTTRLAEAIKAEVSKGVWIEQNKWNLKREFYATLLDCFSQSIDAIDSIIELESNEPNLTPEQRSRQKNLWKDNGELFLQIRKAVGPARLFLETEALSAINRYYQARHEADQAESWWEHLEGTQQAAKSAYTELLIAAKKDLGIENAALFVGGEGDIGCR